MASTKGKWKPYPKMKESGIEWLGEIPEGWKKLQLKYLTQISYGLSQPPVYQKAGTPLLRATNVSRGRITEEGLVLVDSDLVPKSKNVRLKAGDIIVVRSGAYTGDSAIVPSSYAGAIAGYDMIVRPVKIRGEFLAYSLLSAYVFDRQMGPTKLRAAQPHLNAEEIGSCIVLVPPLSEQKAIAAFLDRETARIDQLIEKKQRLIELLQEKRQAMISHAVTKGLDPNAKMKDSGIEWLGEIPEGWEIAPLRWQLSLSSGDSIATEEFGEHGDIPVIGGNGVAGYTTKSNSQEDTIAIGRVGALCGNVHLVKGQSWITDNALRLRNCRRFELSYLALWLTVIDINQYANKNAQPLITGEIVKRQIALIPPRSEQLEVAAYIENRVQDYERIAVKIRLQITKLKEKRQALISAAVTGKIDVRSEVPA